MVGTRIGMLLYSLNPIFGALLAWPLLGETLQPVEILAMLVALSGAAWVVLERGQDHGPAQAHGRRYLLGLALALGGGLCQALGLIVRQTWAGRQLFTALGRGPTHVRGHVGDVGTGCGAWPAGRHRADAATRPPGRAVDPGRRTGGALSGGLAVNGGVQAARVGVASTLMAMTPVLLLPLVHGYTMKRSRYVRSSVPCWLWSVWP